MPSNIYQVLVAFTTSGGIRAPVRSLRLCLKKIMAQRRQQRLDDVYDREIEQQRLDQRMDERFERMMEQMTERMTALLANQNRNNPPPQNCNDFADNLDEGNSDEEIEVPHRRRRNGADEDRR